MVWNPEWFGKSPMTAAIACEWLIVGGGACLLPLTGKYYCWADEMAGVFVVVVVAADVASVEEGCGGRKR
jgi:hypothetical protein